MKKYGFKLKGTEPIKFYLSCDFSYDEDGILFFGSKQYIQKMMQTYEQMFGSPPKEYSCPLPPAGNTIAARIEAGERMYRSTAV